MYIIIVVCRLGYICFKLIVSFLSSFGKRHILDCLYLICGVESFSYVPTGRGRGIVCTKENATVVHVCASTGNTHARKDKVTELDSETHLHIVRN